MVIELAPIQKIRANINTLLYLVPENLQSQIKIGSRVVAPFRSRKIIAIVWKINPSLSLMNVRRNLKSIETIFDPEFINSNQHQFFDWIANFYLTSLPTVLATAIPEEFRQIKKDDQILLSPGKNFPQQLIIVPFLNYPNLNKIKFKNNFIEYSLKLTPEQKALTWKKVREGENLIVAGTYLPIYLPFRNLKKITIFEPEEDLYKYEQTPKLNIVHACYQLAKIYQSTVEIKTYSPYQVLLPATKYQVTFRESQGKVDLIDTSKEKKIINFQTDYWLEERLNLNRQIIIFQQGLKLSSLEQDLRKIFPQKTIQIYDPKNQDKKNLDPTTQILITNQKILYNFNLIKADLLILSVERFLDSPDFCPEKFIAHLNKVARFSLRIAIQTNNPQQEILQAIKIKKTLEYLKNLYQHKSQKKLYPFGLWIKLSFKHQSEEVCHEESQKVSDQLKEIIPNSVKIYGPAPGFHQKLCLYYILIHFPDTKIDLEQSIPLDLRDYLLSLSKPWSIDPHPVNLL